jgi:hypothetical protein
MKYSKNWYSMIFLRIQFSQYSPGFRPDYKKTRVPKICVCLRFFSSWICKKGRIPRTSSSESVILTHECKESCIETRNPDDISCKRRRFTQSVWTLAERKPQLLFPLRLPYIYSAVSTECNVRLVARLPQVLRFGEWFIQ